MAQDSLQDEIHLYGHCICLDFWFRIYWSLHDINLKGKLAIFIIIIQI